MALKIRAASAVRTARADSAARSAIVAGAARVTGAAYAARTTRTARTRALRTGVALLAVLGLAGVSACEVSLSAGDSATTAPALPPKKPSPRHFSKTSNSLRHAVSW